MLQQFWFSATERWEDQPVISKYFCTAEGFHPFFTLFPYLLHFFIIFLPPTSSLPHSDAFFDSSAFPAMPTNAFINFSLSFSSQRAPGSCQTKITKPRKKHSKTSNFSHRKSNRNVASNHNRAEILLETCSNLMQGKQQTRCIPSVLNEIPRFPSGTPQLRVPCPKSLKCYCLYYEPWFTNNTSLISNCNWLGEKNIRRKGFLTEATYSSLVSYFGVAKQCDTLCYVLCSIFCSYIISENREATMKAAVSLSLKQQINKSPAY